MRYKLFSSDQAIQVRSIGTFASSFTCDNCSRNNVLLHSYRIPARPKKIKFYWSVLDDTHDKILMENRPKL